MDHFPTFNPTARPAFRVLYTCTDKFEDEICTIKEFKEYGSRAGFLRDREIVFDVANIGEMPPFIQNWFYFGLLSVTLAVQGLKLTRDDFIQKDGPESTITSANLNQYIDQWIQREQTQKQDVRVRQDQMKDILNYTRDLLSSIQDMLNIVNQDYLPTGIREILHSISALAFTITAALKCIWNTDFLGFGLQYGPGTLFLDRLRAEKWCPHDIEMLRQCVFIDSHYYCLTMRPPRRNLIHKSCTPSACQASNVEDQAYVTKHVTADCTCEHIEIPTLQLERLVEDEKIPLARYVNGQLQVVENDGKIPNVAFSHVWADGLGNNHGNSLPHCQLNRLQSLANDLYWNRSRVPVAFYIDTLCVPTSQHLRKEAIRKLRKVYSEAAHVLVLDHELQSEPHPTDIAQLITRLFLSGWVKRLWTLQEGSLNHSLHLKLSRCIFPVAVLYYWSTYVRCSKNWQLVFYGPILMASFLQKTHRILDKQEMPKSLSLLAISDACWWRSTSRARDEPVCIAVLLGLDPEPLLDATDDSERMPILLKMIVKIPLPLLVLSGDRVEKVGFRWAPKSLLGFGDHDERSSLSKGYSRVLQNILRRENKSQFEVAEVMQDGDLSVRASGWRLLTRGPKGITPVGEVFWLGETASQMQNSIPVVHDFYRVRFLQDKSGMPETLTHQSLYIIRIGDKLERNSYGVLAIGQDETKSTPDGVVHCVYYCRLGIEKIGGYSLVSGVSRYREELMETAVVADPVQNQRWQIS